MVLFSRIKKPIILLAVLLQLTIAFSQAIKPQSTKDVHSILLLIDVSGSMAGAKIDSVKSATKQIIRMLLPCNTEFSVMAFSGKKDDPNISSIPFTTNENELFSYIDQLKAEGGTPLGAALKRASFYFTVGRTTQSKLQSIFVLGDGRSDDNITEAIKELKERNSIIQCECIGFDIENDKPAQEQLKLIAKETGGEYYVANHVSNVAKAYLKTGIKTIISEVPVEVRQKTDNFLFPMVTANAYRMLISQNWLVDSIQINVSPELYEITNLIAQENVQDTLPKSLVFDTDKTVSLFIKNGSTGDVNKKWVQGTFRYSDNMLSINIQQYFLKLKVKKIEKNAMVLCVNKFRNNNEGMPEGGDEICDCNNKMKPTSPYILIYFSKAGCR